MEYFETIYNVETGQTTTRPYTDEEIKQMKIGEAAAAKRAEIAAAKDAQKSALLAKLGITAEEAALLLG
jgi:hypothetical protein